MNTAEKFTLLAGSVSHNMSEVMGGVDAIVPHVHIMLKVRYH